MKNSIPKNSVIKYIRKFKSKTPYGVLVATKNQEGGYNLGYSLCNKKDRFNKEMALKIAFGRTENEDLQKALRNKGTCVPHNVIKNIDSFIERCNRYYKCN
jgi:hypothetical protein